MALTKKISLLCMSVLTLNFINSNLYSMRMNSDSMSMNSDDNLLSEDNFNYGFGYSNIAKDYDSMLELYKNKSNIEKRNNKKQKSDNLPLDFNPLEDENILYNNDFLLELNETVNKIKDTGKKTEFINKVKNILEKFKITGADVDEALNSNSEQHFFIEESKENKLNTNVFNAMLSDFLGNKKLSNNLMIDTFFVLSKSNNNLAKFVMECIILNLDVNKKFDLLWSLCNRCDRYASANNRQDKFNYLMDLVQKLSCMVSYDVNELHSNSNDKIVAKLLPLMISYYKQRQFFDDNTKNIINENLVKYIRNMKDTNNDSVIKKDPSKSLLLFVRDNILSKNNKHNENIDDNQSVISFHGEDFYRKNYKRNDDIEDEDNVEIEDILSKPLSNKIVKLRNMVMVNHAILNNRKTFNQKIPSFSEQKSDSITSDNMSFFVKYIYGLLQQQNPNSLKEKLKEDNIDGKNKLEALQGIFRNQNNIITTVINLAVTPDSKVNGIDINYLRRLFIDNAPKEMKIFSKSEEDNSLVVISENNLLNGLYELFKNNNERVRIEVKEISFLQDRPILKNEFSEKIYQKLKLVHASENGNKYVTNELRREIINDELQTIFNVKSYKTISEFTNSLSPEDCNKIIIELLKYNEDLSRYNGKYDNNKVYEYLKQNVNVIISEMIRNKIRNNQLFLQRYINYCKDSQAVLKLIKKASVDHNFYRYVMGDFSNHLSETIWNGVKKIITSKANNQNGKFKGLLKLFNSCNSHDVQSWFMKGTDQYKFITDFVNGQNYKNVKQKTDLFKIINSLKKGYSIKDDDQNTIEKIIGKNKRRAENLIMRQMLGTILDNNIKNNNVPIDDNGVSLSWNKISHTIEYPANKSDVDNVIKDLILSSKIYKSLNIADKENIKKANNIISNLDIQQMRNAVKAMIDYDGDNNELRNNAKKEIAEFIQKYNNSILEMKQNNLSVLLIPEKDVKMCAEIFLNFIKAQNKTSIKNILKRMSNFALISMFKGIMQNNVKNQGKCYQMNKSEFIKYIMNGKIMREYFTERSNNNNNNNHEAVINNIRESLLSNFKLCSNDDCTEVNLLGVFLLTNNEEQNDEIQREVENVKLNEPKTQNIDIEFEDFSDNDDKQENTVGNILGINNDVKNNLENNNIQKTKMKKRDIEKLKKELAKNINKMKEKQKKQQPERAGQSEDEESEREYSSINSLKTESREGEEEMQEEDREVENSENENDSSSSFSGANKNLQKNINIKKKK